METVQQSTMPFPLSPRLRKTVSSALFWYFRPRFEKAAEASTGDALQAGKNFRLQEFLQSWLKDESIPFSMERLRDSTPTLMNFSSS
jgi:hypothetical protein